MTVPMAIEGPQQSTYQHDEFLSPPNEAINHVFPRATALYTNQDHRFKITKRSYDRQYAQLYYARLMILSDAMSKKAAAAWPGVAVHKILEVGQSSLEGQEVVVIGTVYKGMKLKPSILDEYTKDRGLKQALGGTNFCSDDDMLVLEDEAARMVLRGDLPVHQLVTGVVMAVKGRPEAGGDFIVNAICYADLPPQPAPLPKLPEDKYIALISGLALGSLKTNVLQLQLAMDFLMGNSGSGADQRLSSQVVQLVVAGGSVGALEPLATAQPYSRQQNAALQPVKDMDMYLMQLATALPVDVMPGAEDPTNVALPQQPLHRCLFPGAAAYSSFQRVTNPHEFSLDGIHFLGTSGQNIDDLGKYTREEDRLVHMQNCLRWRHLAPTAPDTLSCYPFDNDDPFILESCPHVFFVGNQPEFKTNTIQGAQGQAVTLISVPKFSRTGMLVLLNLRTLMCHPMTFDSSMEL